MIRPARPDESGPVSDLALRSKSHWGYDADFLEACRPVLTWTPEQCAAGLVTVAEIDGVLRGMYVVDGAELDALFVDVPVIGTGLGAQLLLHALDRARAAGVSHLGLDADPGAEAFYVRHGAHQVGESPSEVVPGRTLSRLVFDIGSGEAGADSAP